MVIDILCTSLVNQALNWTNEQERDRRTDKEEETEGERQIFDLPLFYLLFKEIADL